MLKLNNLHANLFNTVMKHLHITDIESLKRTNKFYFDKLDGEIQHCECQYSLLKYLNVNYGATIGSLEIIRLLPNVDDDYKQAMFNACFNNHLHIVKWLNKNKNGEFNENIFDGAVKNGNLDIVKYLCENIIQPTEDSMHYASLNGHYDIIKYLCVTYPHMTIDERVIDNMSRNGSIEMIEYILNIYGPIYSNNSLFFAASSSDLDCIKFMHNIDKETHVFYHGKSPRRINGKYKFVNELTSIIDTAALKGNIEIINWLLENRNDGFTQRGIREAERNNHFDVVELLNNNMDQFVV